MRYRFWSAIPQSKIKGKSRLLAKLSEAARQIYSLSSIGCRASPFYLLSQSYSSKLTLNHHLCIESIVPDFHNVEGHGFKDFPSSSVPESHLDHSNVHEFLSIES